MTTNIEFPSAEDVQALSADDLNTLHTKATEEFDAVYGDGSNLDDEAMDTLGHLTEGIEVLSAEATRRQREQSRSNKAAEMAARVHANSAQTGGDEDTDSDSDGDTDGDDDTDTTDDEDSEGSDDSDTGDDAPEGDEDESSAHVEQHSTEEGEDTSDNTTGDESMAASGRNSRAKGRPRQTPERGIKDVLRASGEGTDYTAGTGIDWGDVGQIVERRLRDYNHTQYANANRGGRHVRQQFGVATIERPVDGAQRLEANDPEHVEDRRPRAGRVQRPGARRERPSSGCGRAAAAGWLPAGVGVSDRLGRLVRSLRDAVRPAGGRVP